MGIMAQGHIYIYGEIVDESNKDPKIVNQVSLVDVLAQINANKTADEVYVHMVSNGGDVYEGWAIYSALENLKKAGKKLYTIAEGMVASIASIIYCVADLENRSINRHADLVLHNPFGTQKGDSEAMFKYADLLKKEEEKMAGVYSESTGLPVDEILAIMKEETYLNAEEAIKKGFASKPSEPIKAVAKLDLNNKTNSKMEKKEVQELINASLEDKSLLEKVADKVKAMFKPKAMVKQDGTGKELEFPDLQEGDEIKVGDKVNTGGAPANGDFVMPDGVTLKVAGGVITEIVPKAEPATEPAPNEEMEDLKAELKKREEDIKALKADMKALKESIETDPGIKAVRETVSPSGMKIGYKPKK